MNDYTNGRPAETYHPENMTQPFARVMDTAQEEAEMEQDRLDRLRDEINQYFEDFPEVETVRFSRLEDGESVDFQGRFDALAKMYDGVLAIVEDCFGKDLDLGSANRLLSTSDQELITQHNLVLAKLKKHPLAREMERALDRWGTVEEALIQVRDLAKEHGFVLQASTDEEEDNLAAAA